MNKRLTKRHAITSIIPVIDRRTDKRIGNLENLSVKGVMIATVEPIKTTTTFQCKLEFEKPILKRVELWFNAKCCWSRKNVSKDRWESGFQIELFGIDREIIEYLSLVFTLDGLQYVEENYSESVTLENRRNNVRYRGNTDFPLFEKNSSVQTGTLVDISQSGMMVLSDLIIKKDDIVENRIKLPKRIFQRDYLILESECRWSKKDEKTGKFRVGLQFQNLSQKDAVIILHLIIHYLQECVQFKELNKQI